MIENQFARRLIAAALMVAGAISMLLAPPIWLGAIPLAIGVLLETAGILVEHRKGNLHRPSIEMPH
jgi:hypothetical protein